MRYNLKYNLWHFTKKIVSRKFLAKLGSFIFWHFIAYTENERVSGSIQTNIGKKEKKWDLLTTANGARHFEALYNLDGSENLKLATSPLCVFIKFLGLKIYREIIFTCIYFSGKTITYRDRSYAGCTQNAFYPFS